MSPEYGSTITVCPIDDETPRYLRLTGRPAEVIDLVERYAKEQGLWFDPAATPAFSSTIELDLSTVFPSLAGPARPQDRVRLDEAKARCVDALPTSLLDHCPGSPDDPVDEPSPGHRAPPAGTSGDVRRRPRRTTVRTSET